MKIAVVHNLPAGGQKRALYQQLKILSKHHTTDVFTLSTSSADFFPLKHIVNKETVYRYEEPPQFPFNIIHLYTRLPNLYKKMASDIDRVDYDVVYVNACKYTQAPYILRYLRTPTVYFCHEPKREFYEPIKREGELRYRLTLPFRLPLKAIDYLNARKATRIIANSSYSSRLLKRLWNINTDIVLLGVDSSIFRNYRIKKRDKFLLSVGELTYLKGYDFIIQSLALISKSSRLSLIAVGHSGIEARAIKKIAHDLDVDLEILQNISDIELVRLYNQCTAFLFTARYEPFGLVLLEAASCGAPIIAVKEGAVEEVTSGISSVILTKRSTEDFSAAISALEFNKTNHDNSGFIKKNHSWEVSVKKLETILRETACT